MPVFEDAQAFALHIEHRVLERGTLFTHLDAILEYCSENQVEPEDLKTLVKGALKDKLELCYQELNYIPKGATLDL
jgi:hypothetical protein